MKKYFLTVCLLGIMIFSGCTGRASPRDIRVDGRFADWTGLPPAYTDPFGDAPAGRIDIGRVWLSNNDKRFFIRFELNQEISLQAGDSLDLYLDMDDDSLTGDPVNGIGADLSWRFGERIRPGPPRSGYLHGFGLDPGKIIYSLYGDDGDGRTICLWAPPGRQFHPQRSLPDGGRFRLLPRSGPGEL